MSDESFAPVYGSSQTLTAAASSAVATIGKGNNAIRVTNNGTNPAFVKVGFDNTISAAVNVDLGIAGGDVIVIRKDRDAGYLAYQSNSGTSLLVTPGDTV